MDGPVVILAKKALEKGDATLVLPWVAKEKEGEIREAFDLTLAVRGKGAKEKEVAGRYFFETRGGGGAGRAPPTPTRTPPRPASTSTDPPAEKQRRHRPRRKIMRYLILGGGPAGIAAAKAIRKREKDAAIVIATEETASPYLRPLLPDFISGDIDLSAMADPQGEDPGPKGREDGKGRRGGKVSPGGGRVILEDGTGGGCAFLLVATGGKPIVPVP